MAEPGGGGEEEDVQGAPGVAGDGSVSSGGWFFFWSWRTEHSQ